MNRFWQLIISIRDFGYHWSVKQDGDAWLTNYKERILAFASGYVLTLLLVIYQTLFYVGFDLIPTDKNSPWYLKIIGAIVLIALPCYLVSRFLWKKIDHVPIAEEYSAEQYYRGQRLFWIGFFLGWFLLLSVGITLPAYLRGMEIDFFGIIVNEGGNSPYRER